MGRLAIVGGFVILGAEGPEFKSRQPDKQCAGQMAFPGNTLWPVIALGVCVGVESYPVGL